VTRLSRRCEAEGGNHVRRRGDAAAGQGAVDRRFWPRVDGPAEMIAELHWSTTPLESITDWPHSLRTAVGICLASRHPMVIWWDPE
jgi:hypothetical protein